MLRFVSLRTLASLFFLTAALSLAQTPITKTYIEGYKGWQACSICSGANGNGVSTPYMMVQNVASPSMAGAHSAAFLIYGNVSYGSALWWEQLGPSASAHNFVYDVYFYMTNPTASQALEFDVNQSVGGHKFVFGTQCNFVMHTFDVWGGSQHWVPTGLPCATPTAYSWNHLTLELQRNSTNQVMFVSLTMNGTKSYINRSFPPIPSAAQELNVAFQMDGRKVMTPYQVNLEDLSLKYW